MQPVTTEGKKTMVLPTEKRGPIQRTDLAKYAEASGDNNRIHLDDEFAKQAGFPSVIAHGMLSMAYLADYLVSRYPESQYRVVSLKSRFRRVIFPGDVLEIGGTQKAQDSSSLSVSLWIKNQQGEVTTDGEAELAPLTR